MATLALIVVFAITFAASRHGAALAVTAADDRVVQWFAELRGPASWWSIRVLGWCLIVPLLLFKRFRHLILYVVVIKVTFYLVVLVSTALKRPRPSPAATSGRLRRRETPATPPTPQKDLLGDVLGLVTIDQMGAHPPTSAWLCRMNAAKAKRSPSRAGRNNRVSSSITPLLSLLGVQTDPRGHRSTDKSTDTRIAHDRTARSLHPAMSASAAAGAAR